MTHEEISLPMTGDDTIGDLLRSFFYADEVLDGLIIRSAFGVYSSVFMPASQAFEYYFAKLAARPEIQVRVDRFMRNMHSLVHRIQYLEAFGNLFRCPALIKVFEYELSQSFIGIEFALFMRLMNSPACS